VVLQFDVLGVVYNDSDKNIVRITVDILLSQNDEKTEDAMLHFV
jgi:hypothetical protein